MVVSSGGVSRASGMYEEMPKDLKDGSWRCREPFTRAGSDCMFVV